MYWDRDFDKDENLRMQTISVNYRTKSSGDLS